MTTGRVLCGFVWEPHDTSPAFAIHRNMNGYFALLTNGVVCYMDIRGESGSYTGPPLHLVRRLGGLRNL